MSIVLAPKRLTGPAQEPVSLAEAKLAAKVDGSEQDTLVAGLITVAREQAEQLTNRLFGAQIWRAELADWPAADQLLEVYGPTAVAVSYRTGATWTAVAPEAVAWAASGRGTVVAPVLGGSWPTLAAVALGPRVRIDITAGEEAEESVKLYIKASVTHWLQSPAAAQAGTLTPNPLFARLLDRSWVV
ncbi:hypothetical protein [Aquincola sp. J276]|uniref:head-tail connector protein n=1 Tax=Aquincola sp. J276 TaxID=2898432 RepID=UPI0021511370|nr:hypothetical protein [Aquincola sp. J276]MCR5864655.1 hypothetical protein [Aquincola sp. J276]